MQNENKTDTKVVSPRLTEIDRFGHGTCLDKNLKETNSISYYKHLSGSWKTLHFKQYNFNAKGMMPSYGCLHPLLKVRTEYRQIFLEMG